MQALILGMRLLLARGSAPVLFFGLNGYLLGREYFQMAAARRMHRDEVRALYQRNKMTIWLAGAATPMLAS